MLPSTDHRRNNYYRAMTDNSGRILTMDDFRDGQNLSRYYINQSINQLIRFAFEAILISLKIVVL